MPRPSQARRQSGFTLIEIAIVLVIIGLLLGGILKGQELINSARVKNLASDFRNVPVFIYGYQDKFKTLPGDDPAATAHVGATATNGNGNGVIEGNWNDSATPTPTEAVLFWQHVRMAGLAPGPTSTSAADFQPRNASGGGIGIQSSAPFTGMTGSYFVCSGSILGRFAKQLDIQLDDGNTATGSLMVGTATGGAPTATASVADSTAYVVCMGI